MHWTVRDGRLLFKAIAQPFLPNLLLLKSQEIENSVGLEDRIAFVQLLWGKVYKMKGTQCDLN